MEAMRILFRNLGYALLLTFASVFINHLLGFNTERHDLGDTARNSVTIVFWCSIFLTIVQMRPYHGSEHNFFMAFKGACIYVVLYSGAFAIFVAIYQHFINPQFYPTYRIYFEKRLVEAKIPAKLLAVKMRQFDMNFNGDFPSYLLLFLYMAMGGVILSAIGAALYRNPSGANITKLSH